MRISAKSPRSGLAGPDDRRSNAFLLIYAIANAGAITAFLPLLTLLLPIKVEHLAAEARVGVITVTVIAGAITASVANILFGTLSDRSVARGGKRRPWIAGGVAATIVSYGGITLAMSPTTIIVAVIVFQISVNAILAPLLAIMAEEIPDAQKGVTSGMLAFANPLAAAVSAALVGNAVLEEGTRFVYLAVVIATCITPLLLTRSRTVVIAPVRTEPHMARRDLALAWIARLLVQIGGNVLFAYLLYYMESVAPDIPGDLIAPRVGRLLTLIYVISLPVAVFTGWLSDRVGRRKPFLFGAASCAASGLVLMAHGSGWEQSAIAFGVYATGSAVFLALYAGFAMELLPNPRHLGRDLGVLNLTHTVPALLAPMLTWLLATPNDFSALMLTLAVLTLAGGGAILAVRGRR